MRIGEDGLGRVNRDEARVIKEIASDNGDLELLEVLSHYLATRITGHSKRFPRLNDNIVGVELLDELQGLPVQVERSDTDPSIEGFSYVYGPQLMGRVAMTLSMAIDLGTVRRESATEAAHILNDLPTDQFAN
jgi:hypothetical protein